MRKYLKNWNHTLLQNNINEQSFELIFQKTIFATKIKTHDQ